MVIIIHLMVYDFVCQYRLCVLAMERVHSEDKTRQCMIHDTVVLASLVANAKETCVTEWTDSIDGRGLIGTGSHKHTYNKELIKPYMNQMPISVAQNVVTYFISFIIYPYYYTSRMQMCPHKYVLF